MFTKRQPAMMREAAEAIDTLRRERDEAREKECHHGWRGTHPEEGKSIATLCPACGCKSLFIGKGGHLTCARVPSGHSDGCSNPDVESVITELRAKLSAAEQSSAAIRAAAVEECAKVCLNGLQFNVVQDGTARAKDVLKIAANKISALAAAPAGYVCVPVEILKFLLGEGPLDGLHFGDIDVKRPLYWWRKNLRGAMLKAEMGEI